MWPRLRDRFSCILYDRYRTIESEPQTRVSSAVARMIHREVCQLIVLVVIMARHCVIGSGLCGVRGRVDDVPFGRSSVATDEPVSTDGKHPTPPSASDVINSTTADQDA